MEYWTDGSKKTYKNINLSKSMTFVRERKSTKDM